jgi:hypothetical protein
MHVGLHTGRDPWLKLETLDGRELYVPVSTIALVKGEGEGSRIWIELGPMMTPNEQIIVRESATAVREKMSQAEALHGAQLERQMKAQRAGHPDLFAIPPPGRPGS